MSEETRAEPVYGLFRPQKLVEASSNSTKIAQNVEAFDGCGKPTHGTFIGARAHTTKHSDLIILSSKCFSSTFERSLFHDPLDTLALKRAALCDSRTACGVESYEKLRKRAYPDTNLKKRAYLDTNELLRGRTNTR